MVNPLRVLILLTALCCAVILTGAGQAASPSPGSPPAARGPQEPPPQQQQPSPAQQPPAQQQPTFRAGINFVRVDVIVTDRKGQPVPDLSMADFEVFEDGKPQKIETFKLVRVNDGSQPGAETPRAIRTQFDEETEAARDDVRLFAIFLDDYHVRLSNGMGVKEHLKRFIQNRLGPADMVALMYPLTPVGDVLLTRDHDAIMEAIDRFEGRKYDYRPRNRIEEKYAMYPASTVERIRNEVALSAIKGLVTHLGGLREGRKAVILVSEGYTNMLPPQLRDPVAAYPGLGNPARGNPMAGEGTGEERAAFFANTELQRDLREVYDTANKHNTAIYAVDPRGLAAAEFDINEAVGMQADRLMLQNTMDTLRVLADETDGRAIVNRNDIESGMKQIVADSSAYYLLGYSSTQAPQDGKFHEIKVRVKRSGTDVRARKGYWALTPEETARALAPPKPGPPEPVMDALAAIAEPRGRLIRSWFGAARGENGKTRVTFLWEPAPRVPGTTRAEPVRVQLTAGSEGGVAYFRGRVPDAAVASIEPAAGAAAAAAATPARAGASVTFEADPGRVQLRMSVEGRGGEVVDFETRDIFVPDLTAPQTLLSSLTVYRAQNALQFRSISNDPAALPTATREFRRSDRLLIRFEAYGAGGVTPTVTARLLNRNGEGMSDLPVKGGTAPGFLVDLPLSGLASGEYLVEVKASAPDGDATGLVAMRITG